MTASSEYPPHHFDFTRDGTEFKSWCKLHPCHKGPHFNGEWFDRDGNEIPAPTREEQAANCPHESVAVEIPSETRYITYVPSPCIHCGTPYELLVFRNPETFAKEASA
jgi:hypothetical protein